MLFVFFFFFQAEDGIRDVAVTGVQTCALPICVIANRFWEQIFGIGIVRTSEDFGSQGDLPTHPELLDWLATELVAHKWDVKAFLRMIVTSAMYRQSSRVSPELQERDPNNVLLARGPRFRMPAEEV